MNIPFDSGPTWTAVLYLLGELNAEEHAAFETTLAEDQAAREALAEAVALIGGLQGATPGFGRGRSSMRQRSPMLAAVVGLAAALLLWLAWPRPDTAGNDLALAWSGLVGQAGPDAADLPEEPEVGGLAADADWSSPEGDDEESVPAWMLEVVSRNGDAGFEADPADAGLDTGR